MNRQTDGQTLVSQLARQTDKQLGFVAYKIPLFGPERVRGEGEVSGLSLAFVLLLHTNNLNGREGGEREGRGERREGRREGGSTISESSVYPKATATLKVVKLCKFHFHNLTKLRGGKMARWCCSSTIKTICLDASEYNFKSY